MDSQKSEEILKYIIMKLICKITTFKPNTVKLKDGSRTKSHFLYYIKFSVQSFIVELYVKTNKKSHPLLSEGHIDS